MTGIGAGSDVLTQNGETEAIDLEDPARQRTETLLASVQSIHAEAESLRTKLEQIEAEIEASATSTSEYAAHALESKSKVDSLLEAIVDSSDSASSGAQEITALVAKSQKDSANLEGLALKAAGVSEELTKYEKRLDEYGRSYADVIDKINDLLPGAASAGLASSFRARKLTFEAPRMAWSWIFGGCMVLLSIVALFGSDGSIAITNLLSLEDALPYFLRRIPIAVPLVWLAMFAARRYSENARLQEDYAFKEATSMAFEGYKKELQGIDGPDGSSSPLLIYCSNVLAILSLNPGRIFESKSSDPTPLSAITDGARGILKLDRG